MTTVSVALATYNGERFIGEQLESLARQTLLPSELVVCDDASSDDTLAIVHAFAQNAPFPVNMHRNEKRLGFADNFLKAARLCRGELIAFCDQDDVWVEQKLERCATEFDHETVVAVAHSADVTDIALRKLGRRWPAIRARHVATAGEADPWLHVPGFVLTFRSSLRAFDPTARPRSRHGSLAMAHDEWIYLLAQAVGWVVFLPDVLALHRQHADNATGVPDGGVQLISTALATGSSTYRNLAVRAHEFADFFAVRAASPPPLVDGARLRAAEAAYRSAAALWEARSRLHAPDRSSRDRTTELVQILRRGGYRSRARGGLGRRALVKDAVTSALGDPSAREKD